VFEVLDAPVEIVSPPHPKPLLHARGEVRFENVSFGYNGADNPELRDVSFETRAGECTAILGPTGSGKTTLLSLIPRFYDPLRGRVLVDGTDVRELNLGDLRRNVGLVFQESFLFSNTVTANIAFGHPHATREEIEQAARIAAAHEFIIQLPRGYDTLLGEGGKDLSGGQRQRLAIARALLLNPAILLLDDPTAAVDPETEKEILEAIENAMRGRTTFIVANRISTLRRANRIIVLEDGRIVQTGTHDELMRVNGPYRRTAEVQFAE
jgi:ATP-binding cassette subfamily B protein